MTEWRATHIDGSVGGLGAIPPEIQFDPVTGRLYLHAGAGQARDAFALGGNGLLRFLGAQADGTAAVDLVARGLVLRLDAAQVDRVESAAGAGGTRYFIAALHGSPGLSVLTRDAGGDLTELRYQGDRDIAYLSDPVAMVSVEIAEGTLVLATSSSEAGLSSFTLRPDGHLVDLQSLADSTALGLDNVNALELVAAEGVLHAFVTSETETGVTHLSWAPDPDDGQHLGGDRSEALSAGAGDDLLFDGAGSDTLTGGTGADLFVFAADGSRDVITDFMETDMLGLPRVPRPVVTTAGLPSTERTGGDGADVLDGTIGHDRLSGSAGNDTLAGGAGDDTLIGGDDHDQLFGEAGDDSLDGGAGADTLWGDAGNDTIFGNTGVDEVHGGLGDDWISPGDGVDIVHGDGGNDTVIGRTGWDTLWGDDGHDHLYGSEGQDDLHGGDGNDYLSGGFGYDFLWGDAGDDSLYGNLGNDSLDGGVGNDALYGATGNDTLRGGAGHDTLYSSQGVDELEGGPGDDLLFGGSLVDSFHFAPGHGHDVIGDFEAHDRLCLDAALVGGATSAAEVVARFGSIRDGMAVLDFGDSEIVFQTVADLDLLVHSIVLV
ncbi:bifunctional hemolysin/adenylate cyclase [Citreicella sp. SE45]|nr:bifunctional hemolysin/adenylate cyclase [Citreicella sp. SE45]